MHSQWFIRAFLAVWAGSLTVVGASLMVNHWIPLPTPHPNGIRLEHALATADDRWSAVHFLYAECPCSRRILDHVLARQPREDMREVIVLVGGDGQLATTAADHGFEVQQVTPNQLKSTYGVEAAPLFVVVDSKHQVRYAGGYTSRKQGLAVEYDQILSNLLAGKPVQPLPVYGCAVSKGLKSIVDPLRLKSSSRD